MDFKSFKAGDFVKFSRRDSTFKSLDKTNFGILLGLTHDVTPSGMENYVRVHMLEMGGRIFSVLYWKNHDRLDKI